MNWLLFWTLANFINLRCVLHLMVNLPDISDLLEAQKEVTDLHDKFKGAQERLTEVEEEVVRRYKDAKITTEYCNHPVVKYCGMGESECKCCDEPIQ